MGESPAHKLLKQRAKKELVLRGFRAEEIFEEYPVKITEKAYRIDVVGKRENEFVAFECGNTPIQKITDLERAFDEVVQLPYIASSPFSPENNSRKWVLWHIRVPKELYQRLEDFLPRSDFISKAEFVREAVRDRLGLGGEAEVRGFLEGDSKK